MKTTFLKSLKEKNVKLSRTELKHINGGNNASAVTTIGIGAFGGAAATCGDGRIVTCLGTSCTGTDGVGCVCSDSNGNEVSREDCIDA